VSTAREPFGLHNLPYGVFSRGGSEPRIGTRIGDHILDLTAAERTGLVDAGGSLKAATLNELMSLGRPQWTALRRRIADVLTAEPDIDLLVPVDQADMLLPIAVADYVDFYSSRDHASNVGRIFRPSGGSLPANWLSLPIGYHGRAGTVAASGTPVVRPSGLRRVTGGLEYGPCLRLDFEAEVGFVVGTGSPVGEPVPAAEFAERVFGVVLVNDWSARDIQQWESQPLGPFLAKSFLTSISPWVVPLELGAAGTKFVAPFATYLVVL